MELRYSLGKFSTSSSLGLSVFIAELISGILVADTALYTIHAVWALPFLSSVPWALRTISVEPFVGFGDI